MAINNAFWEVHGRGTTPFEQAAYEVKVKAQKAWYATIVAEQIKELNKKASDRTAAINRSYQIVFGRNETPDEQKYWLARPEHYRLLVDVHRNWLYSSAGTDELVKTVARALNFKNKNNPSSNEVKEAMVKFTPGKKIYTEMLN